MNVVKYQNSKVVEKTIREPCIDLKKKAASTKGFVMPSTFAHNCSLNLSGRSLDQRTQIVAQSITWRTNEHGHRFEKKWWLQA